MTPRGSKADLRFHPLSAHSAVLVCARIEDSMASSSGAGLADATKTQLSWMAAAEQEVTPHGEEWASVA